MFVVTWAPLSLASVINSNSPTLTRKRSHSDHEILEERENFFVLSIGTSKDQAPPRAGPQRSGSMPSIPPTRQAKCHCSSDSWTNRILVSLWGLGARNFALRMWKEDKEPEPIRYSLLSDSIHPSTLTVAPSGSLRRRNSIWYLLEDVKPSRQRLKDRL